MTWLDIGLIVILAAFVVKGVMQGMLRQIVGLISVLAAVLLAGRYYPQLAGWLALASSLRPIALPTAYAIILIGVWSLINLAGVVLYDEKGRERDEAWFDDLCGAGVGLLTGVFLLIAMILGAHMLGFDVARSAAHSRVMGWMINLANLVIDLPLRIPR